MAFVAFPLISPPTTSALSYPASAPIRPLPRLLTWAPPLPRQPLARPNIVCFNSGYNVQVMVDEGEPEEVLLRRFRREVFKAGLIQECKRRRFFENKQEEKKRKAREASRRNRRRRFGSGPRSASFRGDRSDAAAPKKSGIGDESQDNWDMPDVAPLSS